MHLLASFSKWIVKRFMTNKSHITKRANTQSDLFFFYYYLYHTSAQYINNKVCNVKFLLSIYCAFNNNIYLLQLGCHPVAVVCYMYTKHEIGYY